MKKYWIVREEGRITAARQSRFLASDQDRYDLIEDLIEFAASGPVEHIATDEPIMLGGYIEKFVRVKG